MTSRERDINRKYKSGWQKRHEQAQRDAAAITGTRSIMTYFGQTTQPCMTAPAQEAEIGVDVEASMTATTNVNETAVKTEEKMEVDCPPFQQAEDAATDVTEFLERDDVPVRCLSALCYSTDLGEWPVEIVDDMREYWATAGSAQCAHWNSDFTPTRTVYAADGKPRKCSRDLFKTTHPLSKEPIDRDWLCYSPSKLRLFCFPCKLMSPEVVAFGTKGFCNWKHKKQQIMEHEVSSTHRASVIKLLTRRDTAKRVDQALVKQRDKQREYWRAVLERLFETISFLSERGLPFRGDNQIVGSAHNGNYLGILELISKFDPFMAQHLQMHANKGKGHTSYLSANICNQLIQLIGQSVVDRIKAEVQSAKYFSISVDSTPDITHQDQLTVTIRYVLPSGPVERFLTFLPQQGHKGEQLADSLLQFLHIWGINIDDCRGQSYDNASNMSGKYRGMQALIRQVNPHAAYIPCAGHSLNLVGQCAAACCADAVSFFDFVQRLYVFFAGSTARWAILKDKLEQTAGRLTLKRLSDTRWSARFDAANALMRDYDEIVEALEDIIDDKVGDHKAETCQEARGLHDRMQCLETGIMAAFWQKVLARFQANSVSLQSADQNLNSVAAIYDSLQMYVQSLREQFDHFEAHGKDLSRCENYRADLSKRVRRRNRRYDESGADTEIQLQPRDKFRTDTFIVIIDSLAAALSKRKEAYAELADRFAFLRKISSLSDAEIREGASKLVNRYASDLQPELAEELVQFKAALQTKLGKEALQASESDDLEEDENDDPDNATICSKIEIQLYRFIVDNGLRSTFANTEIALRIFLCLMVTNCSGERSFSKLKLIKNHLRSTMSHERLNMLSLLSIEQDLLREVDSECIIRDFALTHVRTSAC